MPTGDCRVRGRVDEVVYQGTFTAYAVTTEATHDQVVVHWQNAASSEDIAAVGDEVWLSWAKDHSYLIDPSPRKDPS